MVSYTWECIPCSRQVEENRSMERGPSKRKFCPSCRKSMRRVFGARVHTFSPYVEHNFDGSPIEVSTPGQRDELCAKHGVTYDTYSNLRPRYKRECAVDSLTFDEMATQAKKDLGEWQ